MNKAGIYIHVPFCGSKCAYCDFYSQVRSDAVRENYVRALVNGIEHCESDVSVRSVYIGGGTPSVLSAEQLVRILSAVRSRFEVDDGAEITVEMNPENVSGTLVRALVENGVGRVSMGVQSFVDGELSLLGRKGSAAVCETAFETLRNCGVENISLDLMLAIPSQTEKTLAYSLEKTLSLRPEHISAYLLKVEKNTLFGRRGVAEADEDIQRALYLQTCKTLEDAGYEHYEISNFAKKGFRSVHNSSYWQGVPYLCFGCGASGFDGVRRYKYGVSVDEYIRSDGLVLPETEEILDGKDLLGERIMLSLRTSDGVSRSLLTDAQIRFLKSLESAGLTLEKPGGFRLTDEGFLLSNTIILKLSEFE